MQKSIAGNYKNIRYRVTAELKSLRLAKTGFNYRIQWKRRQNMVETEVLHHGQPESLINKKLTLQFNMQMDLTANKYIEKHIDFLPIVITESGLRSGGIGRIDLTEALNNNQTRVDMDVKLAQCPDPNACLKVSLSYVCLGQNPKLDESYVENVKEAREMQSKLEDRINSVGPTNASFSPARGQSNMMVNTNTQFQPQMGKIQPTTPQVPNFGQFNQQYPQRGLSPPPQLHQSPPPHTHHSPPPQSMSPQIQDLQDKLQKSQLREKQMVAENTKLAQEVTNLQKSLQTKDQQLSNKTKQLSLLNESLKHYSYVKEDLLQKEKHIKQLTTLITNMKQQSLVQSRQSDDGTIYRRKEPMDETLENLAVKLQESQRKVYDLQSQLAQSNLRLAKIFNAAAEVGGHQLLDTLQQSIGMDD